MRQKTSTLAIVALVLSVVGVCGPCLGIVGIVLGIIAVVRINKTPGLGGKGLAIAAIVLPLVSIPLQVAIAIPNFLKFQARSKQGECKANLKALYTIEQWYFQQNERYSSQVEDLHFAPERGNRYAYFLSAQGNVDERSEATAVHAPGSTGVNVDIFKHKNMRPLSISDLPEGLEVGVSGQCPKCSFTAVCIGNVDRDSTLDVWSISSEDRQAENGETISAGVPHNDVNDVLD
jgi:hypothetical protein